MEEEKERTKEEIINEGASRLADIFVDLIDSKEKEEDKEQLHLCVTLCI